MRAPSPPAEPVLDDQQILRQVGFRNAPHTKERCELRRQKIPTALPSWLVGIHYRLAPSIFDINYINIRSSWFSSGETIEQKSRCFNHLFEAIPMLQRFEFSHEGKVFYSSSVLGRKLVQNWESAKGSVPKRKDLVQAMYTSVGLPHGRTWKKRFRYPEKHNILCGSTIVPNFPMGDYRGIEGKLVLHQEGLPFVQEADIQTASVKDCFAYSSLNDDFKGIPCTKPLIDPTSGSLINVLTDFGPEEFATYRILSIPSSRPSSPLEGFEEESLGFVVAKFKAPPTLLQSFAITPNYVIIPIYPLYYAHRDSPSIFKDGGLVEGLHDRLRFDPQADTLFYVVSRTQNCLLAVYRSEASFAFNIVNAFESADSKTLNIDVCSYENDAILGALEMHLLRRQTVKHRFPTPIPRRYTLRNIREEAASFYGAAGQLIRFPTAIYHGLVKQPIEFPTINPLTIGSQNQFIFGLSVRPVDREKPGALYNSIIKIDPLYPHDYKEWSETGCFPSPPVFISTPNDIREDSGVLLTTVLDVMRKRSFLLILDAETLNDLGRYWLPVALSPSFLSGCWIQGLLGPESFNPEIPAQEYFQS